VAENPNDANAHALIAISALSRAKETADSSWYNRAQDAAAAALAIDPNNVPALDATATLANARHRFRDAIPPATTSLRLARDRFAPLEILTDAHLELGHYRIAFALADRRLQLRPDLASSSRASYVAELRGNRALATSLMRLAVDTARVGSGDRAWARTQLGLLEFGSGRLDAAEKQMRIALAEAPDDSTATAGLAKVLAARGDLTAAATLYRRSLDAAPVAAVASELAKVELMRGRPGASRAALAHAHEIDRREEINGVRLDLDGAAVDADFVRPTAADVARARRGHQDRPGVVGDDALGWVLTRAGQCDEGLRYARRSLRLGTRDATMLFHAGMAARCAGHPAEARRQLRNALALNPHFSVLWSPVARKIVDDLTSR
jgi:tetratricopeptide (TPR) repeat protein